MSSDRIWIIQIDQPLCRHRYGNDPCAAVLDTDNPHKCYNTRKSCQDPDNYDPGDTITMSLTENQQGVVQNLDLALPFIKNVTRTPVELNLGTMNRSASPLGQREVLNANCGDTLHSDERFDPYRDERIFGAAQWVEDDTAQAGGTATSIKLASGANAADDYYNGWGVHLNDGSGRTARITDYNGTTKVADITPAWPTNFLTYANDYSNAAWTKVGGLNVTANGAYYTIEDDDGAAYEYLQQTVTVANDSEDYVASVVVAKTTGKTEAGLLFLNLTGGTGVNFGCYFNSNDGSVLNGYSAGASDVGFEDLGDRWRFWVKGTNNGTGNTSAVVELYPAINSLPLNTTNDTTVTQSLDVRDIQLDNNATLGKFVNTVASAITDFPGATTDYSLGQGVDPYTRSTFWNKWLARNPYYQSFTVRSYEGEIDQALSAMTLRYYRMDTIRGPSGGDVQIQFKDLISVIERNKAHVPAVSTGYLDSAITSGATTATLAPTGIGNSEYPASGTLRIEDEVMTFTRSGDTLTITRAQYNTVADAHSAEDSVQVCYVQTSQLSHDIIYDLLLNYTALTTDNLPLATWDIEMAGITGLYTGIVSDPTPVFDIVAEIAEQVGITIYPDVGSNEVLMIPLRAQTAIATITDDDIIDQIAIRPLTTRRVSEMWVYYGQRDPTESLNKKENYRSRAVSVDLTAAGSQQYGTTQTREIFSRWIGQFGRTLALRIGQRLLEQFRDPPIETEFRLHRPTADALELGRPITLLTADVTDFQGNAKATTQVVTAVKQNHDQVVVKTQQLQLSTEDATTERIIYIESDVDNVNLRTIHDSLYAAPTGVETVTFVIQSNVVVKSTSLSVYALEVGSWPSGVTLSLENNGYILGKGGTGGQGGDARANQNQNGLPGVAGGTALYTTFAIDVDNQGTIAGGGGGGGGGGGCANSSPARLYSGGGGGGGAGFGEGGAAGPLLVGSSGGAGTAGGEQTGGAGGPGVTDGTYTSGAGGTGGTPGVAGNSGVAGSGGTSVGSAGAGGAAGNAVVGDSNITWTTTGTRLGAIT